MLFKNTKYTILEDDTLYTKLFFHNLTIQMSLLLIYEAG